MGEYVFDHAWADAYMRAGGRYYPKLQVSVPFTPVTGPRLLVSDRRGPDRRGAALLDRRPARAARPRRGASSIHAHLPTAATRATASPGRAFCCATTSSSTGSTRLMAPSTIFWQRSPRANARRSGASAAKRWRTASSIEWVDGAGHHRGALGRLLRLLHGYRLAQMGPALSQPQFFSLVGERMAERILLVMAKRAGRPIAGALNFIGDARLYGRNWGCIEDHPFLHFEVCYYQAIEFAIARGLAVRRGRRAGRTQARARLPPGHDRLGARHRRSGAAARHRRIFGPRAPACRRGGGGAGGRDAVPASGGDMTLGSRRGQGYASRASSKKCRPARSSISIHHRSGSKRISRRMRSSISSAGAASRSGVNSRPP